MNVVFMIAVVVLVIAFIEALREQSFARQPPVFVHRPLAQRRPPRDRSAVGCQIERRLVDWADGA
jgi:hypothetical protein